MMLITDIHYRKLTMLMRSMPLSTPGVIFMPNIDSFQAADVLIDQKGKRRAPEYIYKRVKHSNEMGKARSYHDWADVLRAYTKLVAKHTHHRPSLH